MGCGGLAPAEPAGEGAEAEVRVGLLVEDAMVLVGVVESVQERAVTRRVLYIFGDNLRRHVADRPRGRNAYDALTRR